MTLRRSARLILKSTAQTSKAFVNIGSTIPTAVRASSIKKKPKFDTTIKKKKVKGLNSKKDGTLEKKPARKSLKNTASHILDTPPLQSLLPSWFIEKPYYTPDVSHKLVGAHVSASPSVAQAIINATSINAKSFALFLKNQRRWETKPLDPLIVAQFGVDSVRYGFNSLQTKHFILPHSSYLINLGNPDKEKWNKSYDHFLDDLKRCEQLKRNAFHVIDLRSAYRISPGSTVGLCSPDESIQLIAKGVNNAHQQTKKIICVLECMAGQGNVIGSTFDQLKAIIDLIHDKNRVGVCLDTCHMFAAGYDISTPEAYDQTMAEFSSTVGFEFLRGMHLNDSKCPLGSKKDRHENLGKGYIGLTAFKCLMHDSRCDSIPMVLETPLSINELGKEDMQVWKNEISLLYSL